MGRNNNTSLKPYITIILSLLLFAKIISSLPLSNFIYIWSITPVISGLFSGIIGIILIKKYNINLKKYNLIYFINMVIQLVVGALLIAMGLGIFAPIFIIIVSIIYLETYTGNFMESFIISIISPALHFIILIIAFSIVFWLEF